MSPLLEGLFSALPACSWEIADAMPFELLDDELISRDEFIATNDVPLVVSTCGGDK